MIQLMDPVDSMLTPSIHGTTLCLIVLIYFNRGVFTDKSLGLVLYYHYMNTNVGIADGDALFGWNQITWSDGWPVV